ncbi:MAG: hypothetical protein AAF226_10860 [Verrucomicrobiota bacterium]
MALEELSVNIPEYEIPADVAALISEADQRIDGFDDGDGNNRRFPQLVPSDPTLQYRAMRWVKEDGIVEGDLFCEWGCGFGFGLCFASTLGFESIGIEIEPELAELSQKLVVDTGSQAQVLCESFFPEGIESYDAHGVEELIVDPQLRHHLDQLAYPGMEGSLHDIDLFYVYPWPSQWEVMQELFETVAREGAVMLIYYGDGEMGGFQKVE